MSPLSPRDQAPLSSPTPSHYHLLTSPNSTGLSYSLLQYYACSICAFTLHLSCSKFSPSLTINHPKAHEHTLTLLPRKNPSPCDACGLSLCRQSDPVYACLRCNYMVHRRCIYLPRVIKITRHPHRLAYTSSLPPLDFSSGFCRESVNIICGQYSCTVGCLYSVHSKCATRKDVWDGKELEGVPLEEEEDSPPFTRIDDQTIHHFSHEHYLRFHGNDDDYDIREEIKFCQACVLPIISDPFYRCMQCNFVLHEACASRSLKIHHPFHIHPLSLVLMPPLPETFKCDACKQRCLGFFYKCGEIGCFFRIDARCASIPEPFNHKSHPHPLYFTLRRGNCMRCDKYSSVCMVECLECSSFLCLECATLPYEAIYKHDKHPLTLCFGEKNASGTYWCEICEGELDAKMWFYRCQECCLTLHVRCVLGVDTNLKPGHSFGIKSWEVNILPNTSNSRPVCPICGSRCKDPQFFKFAGSHTYYCSYGCIMWEI